MNEELPRKQEPEEEAGADLPEGRSGGRRGETARQLIRRAKYASRRKFPAEEKIRIVMEGIRGLAEWKQDHGKKKEIVCLDINRPSHGRTQHG